MQHSQTAKMTKRLRTQTRTLLLVRSSFLGDGPALAVPLQFRGRPKDSQARYLVKVIFPCKGIFSIPPLNTSSLTEAKRCACTSQKLEKKKERKRKKES